MSQLPSSNEFVTNRTLQANTDDGAVILPPDFKPAKAEGVSFSYTDLPVEESTAPGVNVATVDGKRIGLPTNFTPSAEQPEGVSITEFDTSEQDTFAGRLLQQRRLPASDTLRVSVELLERELQDPGLDDAVQTQRRAGLDEAIRVFDLPPGRAGHESSALDTFQASLVGTSVPGKLDAASWGLLRDAMTEEMKQYEAGDPRLEAAARIKAQLTQSAGEQLALEKEAKARGVSPEAQALSKQPGQQGKAALILPVRAAVTGVFETGARGTSRLSNYIVGTGPRSEQINNMLGLQQELSAAYAKEGSFASVFGPDGAVMADQLMQSLPKYVGVGALTGGTGIAFVVAVDGYDRRLHEGLDLPEGQQQAYAVLGTLAEVAIMRAMAVIAGGTAEEVLTPAARHAARSLMTTHGFNGFLKRGLIVSTAEGIEEGTIVGSDYLGQVAFGLRKDFSGLVPTAKSAAIMGVVGGALAHAGAGVVSSVEGMRPKIKDTAEGYTAAGDWFESASDADVETVLGAQTDEDFGNSSGQVNKSPFYRDAFVGEVDRLKALREQEAEKEAEKPVLGPLTKAEAADLEDMTPASDATDPPDQSKVTARHRDLKRFRERMDMDEVSDTGKREFFKTLSEAREEGIPDRAFQIASDHLAEMRPMSGKETIGLTDQIIKLNDDYLAFASRIKGTVTDQEFAANDEIMQLIEQEMDLISEALIRTGTEQGFALGSRRMMKQIDRYKPSELRKRATKAKQGRKKKPGEPDKGKPAKLTDKESKIVKDHATKIAEAEAKVAKLEPGTKEWIDAMWEVSKLKNAANNYIGKLQPGSKFEWTSPFALQNLWRAILTAFDGPAFLRHGYVDFVKRFSPGNVAGAGLRAVGLGRGKLNQGKKGTLQAMVAITTNTARATVRGRTPSISPRKSSADFFRAFASQKQVFKADLDIERHKYIKLARQHQLAIMSADAPIGQREEIMMSSLADKVWVLKRFQRGFRVWLNAVRIDSFTDMVDRFGGPENLDANTIHHIAQYVNSATGRGGLGKFEQSASGLATIFLAPRFFMSRISHGLGWPVIRAAYEGDRVATGILAGEYANFLLGMTSFISMAVIFGKLQFGEDEVDFEPSPGERNFGRLRIGDRQIDITGGLARAYRIMNVVGRGAYSTVTGEDVTQLDTGTSLMGTFTSSFAPGLSFGTGMVLDKTFDGKFNVDNAIANHAMPFSVGDSIEAIQRNSDLSKGGAISVLEMFGGGGFTRTGKK